MIHRRLCWFGLIVLSSIGIFAGCDKPPQKPDPELQTSDVRLQTSGLPVLKLHWLGKKRLATESNATNFMAIWNLPESARLEAQTLDKLATAPWRLLKTASPLSNAPTALLRPLLDDLVQEESYLEVRGDTNQPAELVLAVRLPADRATLWQTNLPIIFHSLSARGEGQGEVPLTSNFRSPTSDLGFRLQTSDLRIDLGRSGDWTLLSITDSRPSTLGPRPSLLLADFQQRLTAAPVPYAPRATNYWLELHANLPALNAWVGIGNVLRTNLPLLDLRLIGENGNVRTTGELRFPSPASIEMEPWNIPTNLVHDPLIGFTAIRGVRAWLKSLKIWREPQLGPPPNQVFFWAQDGAAFLHFFAVPSNQASNQVFRLSELILKEVNPRMAPIKNVRMNSFERNTNSPGLRWRGVPFASPNLGLAGSDDNEFIVGGLFPNRIVVRPMPEPLLHQIYADTNLVGYDWEITELCLQGWIQMCQLGRLIFDRPRLSSKEAVLPWFMAIGPRLGTTGSTVKLVNSRQLAFVRNSSMGFTGAELQLLGDWLESPSFPIGLFTLEPTPAHQTAPSQP